MKKKIYPLIIILLIFISCEINESDPWEGDNKYLIGSWSGFTDDLNSIDFEIDTLLTGEIILKSLTSYPYSSEDGLEVYRIVFSHSDMMEKYSDFEGVKVVNSKFKFNTDDENGNLEPYSFEGVFTDSLTLTGTIKIKEYLKKIFISENFTCLKK